jgi:hypothetical protein
MTTHTTPTAPRHTDTRYVYRDHTVVGTPTQLANVVANHRQAGTFVALTTPRPLTGNRFQVVVRLREPHPAAPATRVHSVGDYARTRASRSRRRTRTAVIVTAVTSTVAGLITVAAYLLGQLVELIAAHAALVVGLVLAALIAALAARRRTSGRRHCPGC